MSSCPQCVLKTAISIKHAVFKVTIYRFYMNPETETLSRPKPSFIYILHRNFHAELVGY